MTAKETNEITPEELEKLWKWCGWKQEYKQFSYQLGTVISPDGGRRDSLPALTLDNLFKYAVPPTINYLVQKNEGWTKYRAIHYLSQAWELEYQHTTLFEVALAKAILEVVG